MKERARLSASEIKKSFGATTALAGATLEVCPGEVHALLGENGAGKSTLVKILAGALLPDAGELRIDGERYAPASPEDARRFGVCMVHQERALCPHLSVADNILLGQEPRRFGLLDRKRSSVIVEKALRAVDPSGAKRDRLAPDVLVRDLGPGERQLVEIARALSQENCRLLLLDEPTSSLGADDVEALFAVINELRASGIAIVYISHHLDEIRRIADRFTVIRDGRTAGSGRVADAEPAEIVAMMAGRPVEDLYPRSPALDHDATEIALSVQDLHGAVLPKGASLTLHRGEVLGIAGLVGSGRTELLRAIFGLDRVRRGEVRVGAFVGRASPAARLAQGVGLVSEDRGGEGLALSCSIWENLTLSRASGLGPFGLVLPSRAREVAARFIKQLGIVARDPDQKVGALSGGNQQKVALARLLYHDVDVLLLDEPTRGVDVGSRAAIYALIDRLAREQKKAVLVVSSSAEELLGISDRIAVMRKGKLGEARPVGDLDLNAVMLEQAGSL